MRIFLPAFFLIITAGCVSNVEYALKKEYVSEITSSLDLDDLKKCVVTSIATRRPALTSEAYTVYESPNKNSWLVGSYYEISNEKGVSYIRELGFKNLHPGLTKRVHNQCANKEPIK